MQTSGEAVYVADVGTSTRELFAAPVESTRALAKLGKVDPAAALKLPGVVDFVGKALSACACASSERYLVDGHYNSMSLQSFGLTA